MKVFVDTNVMIDLLAVREPFFEDAARLFTLAHKGTIKTTVASMSFATASYVLEKQYGHNEIAAKFRDLASIVEIAAVDRGNVLDSCADGSMFEDIEDAMQHDVAIKSGCNVIVTRNKGDFKHSQLPALTPQEFFEAYIKK